MWQIKELEDKLREQERQLQCRLSNDFAELIRATPREEAKTCPKDDEVMSDIDLRILRSSNSVNRPMSQGSILPKGKDYIHQTRKKRESRSGENSNNVYENKKMKPDPPKVAARVIRTTKPVSTDSTATTARRTSRDHQVQGIKDNKKKIWSR